MSSQESRGDLDRRSFFRVGAAAGGAALALATLGPVSVAGAADSDTTVWRLDAEWGYPVGPNGKLRCVCNACHRHAANKIFASEADAVGGRIHICCLCQPVSFTVPGVVAAGFFEDGIVSVDRRWASVAAILSDTDAGATTAAPATLPVTGGSLGDSFAIGAGALGLGALLVGLRNRREPDPTRDRGLTSES